MRPYVPTDLDGWTGEKIAADLYGEEIGAASSWSLNRIDDKALTWTDRRLGLSWRASHGYLVALQEVSNRTESRQFADQNNVTLLQEGGLHFRSVAEVPILCSRPPPLTEVAGFGASFYGFQTNRGLEVVVGYASFLFVRLVGNPAVEAQPSLPDSETVTTLVLRGVDRADVHLAAERALYLLRRYAPGARFELCRFGETTSERLDDPNVAAGVAFPADPLPDTRRPEALTFFNRGQESDPIAGFLYYYRVLEACFEDVLADLVRGWRNDPALSELGLLKELRRLKDQEDITALRRVLSQLGVDQAMLDDAESKGLIPNPTAEALTAQLYQRRNSVAHGRRGQHQEVLVPYKFSPGRDAHNREWLELLRKLAEHALDKFILR